MIAKVKATDQKWTSKLFSLALLLSHLPRSIFLFFHRGDHRKSENRADNIGVFSLCYRLCVLASGSCTMDRFSCRTAIKVSCLHLGQNNGKFSRMVSLRILNRVLLPQTGHNTHSIWLISLLPAASNPIFLDMTGVRMYFVHKRSSCSHCKCDVTAFNRHENIPTGKIQISHRVFGQPHNTVLRNMQPSIASSFIANEFSFINRVLWQCGTII